MHRITQYDGLYGESSARPDGEYVFSERLETRSQGFDWVIQPHIHTKLFQLFYVETGHLTLQEASRQRELTAPFVVLVPPTALHGLTYTPDTTGRILTLSDKLVESLFQPTSAVWTMLGALQCLTRFEEPHSAAQVRGLIEEIDEELFDNRPEKRLMLQACLQRLLLVLFRIWRQNEVLETGPGSLPLQYFRKFQQRIRQAGMLPTVAQLADELAITPVHLNRVCRAVAGKSASQLIQEHSLDEARKYLTYTAYSVSEIAYLLHFEYPNYFARFFRKHTGLSPTEFREGRTQRQ